MVGLRSLNMSHCMQNVPLTKVLMYRINGLLRISVTEQLHRSISAEVRGRLDHVHRNACASRLNRSLSRHLGILVEPRILLL